MKKKGLILGLLLILMPFTVNAVDMAKYFNGGYKEGGVKGTLGDSVKILKKCSDTRVEDDAPLVPLEDCFVTLYLEDDLDTPDQVAEFVEIINMTDGYFHEFRHTTLKRVEGVNNWTYQENGGKYTITPPNGNKFRLNKGERVEVLKFTLAIDNSYYEDGCYAEFDMKINQEVPKCQNIDGKYFDKDGNSVDEAKYREDCMPKCEFKNNKYYDPEGNEVDKDTFDQKCNPKCEFKNNKYYDPDGHEVDKDTYDQKCNPKCEFKDDKYYDPDGHEVDKDTYDQKCNPKCEFKDDKYYDPDGHEVEKEVYDQKCGPKCEIKDGKYYGKNGGEVDKETYDKECNPKCKIENNKYYDKNGNEVDKDTYDKECNPKCRIENNKYYDDEGHEVTKEQWDAKCRVVENPQTGLLIPLIILGVGGISGGIIYYITYRKKIYKL